MSMNHLLPLLLLPLLVISVLCIAEDATELIYDTENNKMTSEESYYVLPAEHGSGGGLGKTGHAGRCKHFVSQLPNEANFGTRVRFAPSNEPTGRNILLSTNITVSFHAITTCMQGMYWHVGYSGLSGPHDRVVAGKYEGDDESYPTPEFTFQIMRHNGKTKGYKLVSCAGEGQCKDLGLSAFEKKNWLAISSSPFVVVFKKAQYPYA